MLVTWAQAAVKARALVYAEITPVAKRTRSAEPKTTR